MKSKILEMAEKVNINLCEMQMESWLTNKMIDFNLLVKSDYLSQ